MTTHKTIDNLFNSNEDYSSQDEKAFTDYYHQHREDFDSAVLTIFYGAPGTGKSVSMLKYVEQLQNQREANITIIDGKGVEWSYWTTDYDNVLDGDSDLVGIYTFFKVLRNDVENALRTGTSSDEIVVIDESYLLFKDEGHSEVEALLVELILEDLTRIVQIGRSSGVRVVIGTQRGTALPISLRKNASMKFAMRMLFESEEEAAFGSVGSPSPVYIPKNRNGLAVVENALKADGVRELVQF